MLMHQCALCYSDRLFFFFRDRQREYFGCPRCALVQVPPRQHLSPELEKNHYDLHENHPEDRGYRAFLARTLEPVCERLDPGAEGLDFGSGPGPTLSLMFRERGFPCENYDIFYASDSRRLERKYDFITATEVVEHLAAPGAVLDRLWSLIRPRGLLAIMTKRMIDHTRFARWHYKNDPTHICFFHRHTFEWLAKKWAADLTFHGDDVVVFERSRRYAVA